MVSRLTILALLAIGMTGCEPIALKCPEWIQKTLPIKPSRNDTLSRGTQDQIVIANESWEANCK